MSAPPASPNAGSAGPNKPISPQVGSAPKAPSVDGSKAGYAARKAKKSAGAAATTTGASKGRTTKASGPSTKVDVKGAHWSGSGKYQAPKKAGPPMDNNSAAAAPKPGAVPTDNQGAKKGDKINGSDKAGVPARKQTPEEVRSELSLEASLDVARKLHNLGFALPGGYTYRGSSDDYRVFAKTQCLVAKCRRSACDCAAGTETIFSAWLPISTIDRASHPGLRSFHIRVPNPTISAVAAYAARYPGYWVKVRCGTQTLEAADRVAAFAALYPVLSDAWEEKLYALEDEDQRRWFRAAADGPTSIEGATLWRRWKEAMTWKKASAEADEKEEKSVELKCPFTDTQMLEIEDVDHWYTGFGATWARCGRPPAGGGLDDPGLLRVLVAGVEDARKILFDAGLVRSNVCHFHVRGGKFQNAFICARVEACRCDTGMCAACDPSTFDLVITQASAAREVAWINNPKSAYCVVQDSELAKSTGVVARIEPIKASVLSPAGQTCSKGQIGWYADETATLPSAAVDQLPTFFVTGSWRVPRDVTQPGGHRRILQWYGGCPVVPDVDEDPWVPLLVPDTSLATMAAPNHESLAGNVEVRASVIAELDTLVARTSGSNSVRLNAVTRALRTYLPTLGREKWKGPSMQHLAAAITNYCLQATTQAEVLEGAVRVSVATALKEAEAASRGTDSITGSGNSFTESWRRCEDTPFPTMGRALLSLRAGDRWPLFLTPFANTLTESARISFASHLMMVALLSTFVAVVGGLIEETLIGYAGDQVPGQYAVVVRLVLHLLVAMLERRGGAPPSVVVGHLLFPWLTLGHAETAHACWNLSACVAVHRRLFSPEKLRLRWSLDGRVVPRAGTVFRATPEIGAPVENVDVVMNIYAALPAVDDDDVPALDDDGAAVACFMVWRVCRAVVALLRWMFVSSLNSYILVNNGWAVDRLALWNDNKVTVFDNSGIGRLPVGASMRPCKVVLATEPLYELTVQGVRMRYKKRRMPRVEKERLMRIIIYVTDYPCVLHVTDCSAGVATRFFTPPHPMDFLSREECLQMAKGLAARHFSRRHTGVMPRLYSVEEELAVPGAYTNAQLLKFREIHGEVVFKGFLKTEPVGLGKVADLDSGGFFTLLAKPRIIVDCHPVHQRALIPTTKAQQRWSAESFDPYTPITSCVGWSHAELSARFAWMLEWCRWVVEGDGSRWDAWQRTIMRTAHVEYTKCNGTWTPEFESAVLDPVDVRMSDGTKIENLVCHLSGGANTTETNTECNLMLQGESLDRVAARVPAWRPFVVRTSCQALGDDGLTGTSGTDLSAVDVADFFQECFALGHPMTGGFRSLKMSTFCSMAAWPCAPMSVLLRDGSSRVVSHYYALLPGRVIYRRGCTFLSYSLNVCLWLLRESALVELRHMAHVPMARVFLRHVVRLTNNVPHPSARVWTKILAARRFEDWRFSQGDETPVALEKGNVEVEAMMNAFYGLPEGASSWTGPGGAEDQLDALLASTGLSDLPFWVSNVHVNQILRQEPEGPVDATAEF